jgi:hypothetical protein
MSIWLQRLLMRVQKEAGEDGEAGGGGGIEPAVAEKPAEPQKPAAGSVDNEKADLIKDLMKWKSKAKDLESQFTSVSDKAKQADAYKDALGDMSLDDLKGLIAQRKDTERVALEKKGEYDRILQQVREENAKIAAQLQTQLEEVTTKLSEKDKQIVELTIGRAFRDSEFVRESSALPASIAQREFGDHFEFIDGRLVGYDKPRGASDRTPLVDDNGDYRSFDAAISALYLKHPDSKNIIRSKQKGGTGSTTVSVTPAMQKQATQLKGIDKIAAGLGEFNKGK